MGVGRLRLPILLVALLAAWLAPGHALGQSTETDWQRGVVTARCAVPGDLRAPSREMARIKGERQARERCRSRLVAALARVPLARGLEKSQVSESTWPVATTDIDYGMDGSVAVHMVLPIDALRTVFAEPDALVPMTSSGPPALIVDARKLPVRPAAGYRLSDGTVDYHGPSVFFADEKLARQDARVGNEATIVNARSARAGAIQIEKDALEGLLGAQPLVVILVAQDTEGAKK